MGEERGVSGKTCGEIARGDNRGAFVVLELKQTTLIPRYKVIGVAGFRQGQQVIVIWIGRTLHARQWINVLG